jgi:iron complex outermembrane receptor protein
MSTNLTLSRAVHVALMSSAATLASLYTTQSLSQEAETSLSEIVVTGTRIRRVEQETASPVYIVNRDVIEQSGSVTMGELMQTLPVVSGAATNTSVNNGGGDGAATIELRGLGEQRTLVLLNGRRMTGIADNGAVDVNLFPVNLIERVDVLKEGAGSVYGTDAIGGVVNFITRTDIEGLELSYDYGVTSESDGKRHSVGLAWGTHSDRGNVIIGANYNQQDEVSAGDRAFTREAIYLYGSVFAGGSSRTPNGRIRFNEDSPLHASNGGQFNCEIAGGVWSVTKLPDVDGTSLDNYRCWDGLADPYNYQPLNLVVTPQERGTLFVGADYQVAEDVQMYSELLHNYTTSGFQIAELPFDSRDDNVIIPANNFYNPFGQAFGGIDGVNTDAEWRMQALGTRHSKTDTTTDQATLGFRGPIMDSSWEWDVSASYSRVDQDVGIDGYLVSSKLQDAFGPSFLDPVSGEVVCGVPGDIIAGCVPINIFDVNNPDQQAALDTIAASYNTTTLSTVKSFAANFTGDLVTMPAGELQLAVGAGYDDYFFRFDTDALTDAQPPDFLTCGLAQETCSSDTRGDYHVGSLYVEGLIPILADVPGAAALNLIVGTRYSDFSTFGDTTDSSAKIEWRPVQDLLVRASWSEVFRSPQVADLFGGVLANAPTFNDPCVGLTAAQVAANPNYELACENVTPDGTFQQPNAQITGLFSGNRDLQPETGEVINVGFVFQPAALGGFSMSLDYWQYELDDVITPVDVNTAAEVCVESGDPVFCGLIDRLPDGSIRVIQQPTLNFGTLETSGYDVGFRYVISDTPAGTWQFGIDGTYIDKFDSTPCDVCGTTEVAGTFDRQYGNYAEWRGLASIGWSFEPFSALLSARYIGDLVLHDPDAQPGVQPDLQIPSSTYLDLTFGYSFKENLQINVGMDNITDEKPPLLYQNNVINSNTDVSTYDVIGPFYRASLKYEFK